MCNSIVLTIIYLSTYLYIFVRSIYISLSRLLFVDNKQINNNMPSFWLTECCNIWTLDNYCAHQNEQNKTIKNPLFQVFIGLT